MPERPTCPSRVTLLVTTALRSWTKILTAAFLTNPPRLSLFAITRSASTGEEPPTETSPISGKLIVPFGNTRVVVVRSGLPYTVIFSTSPAARVAEDWADAVPLAPATASSTTSTNRQNPCSVRW